jgi:hypothetical protein
MFKRLWNECIDVDIYLLSRHLLFDYQNALAISLSVYPTQLAHSIKLRVKCDLTSAKTLLTPDVEDGLIAFNGKLS